MSSAKKFIAVAEFRLEADARACFACLKQRYPGSARLMHFGVIRIQFAWSITLETPLRPLVVAYLEGYVDALGERAHTLKSLPEERQLLLPGDLRRKRRA